jgi:uncharacterized protein YbcC (UPF0753/DUF2309 family)
VDSDLARLESEIHSVAQLLPLQGPITAFAFLNPLDGLEDQPFNEAMRRAAAMFGCEPFLPETRYRQELARGRITERELKEVLSEECGDEIQHRVGGLVRRLDLRLSMLLHSLSPGTEPELRWLVAESDALSRFRSEVSSGTRQRLLADTQQWIGELEQAPAAPDDSFSSHIRAVISDTLKPFRKRHISSWSESKWEGICLRLLWNLAQARMESTAIRSSEETTSIRHRDLLVAATRHDPDLMVHKILVRFCAAFLDQGYAHWSLPNREFGFLASFSALFLTEAVGSRWWLKPLDEELQRLQNGAVSPLQSIAESLLELGIEAHERREFLQSTLLALRGWAGMIWQTESRPDRVFRSSPPGTLTEFLAVRLILDRLATASVAQEVLRRSVPLKDLRNVLAGSIRKSNGRTERDQRAYQLLQLAQLHGWSPGTLAGLTDAEWSELIDDIDSFANFERRRIFQAAFERQLANHALDAIALRAARPLIQPALPQLQVITCLDAREESFRRHLEEVAPDVETFGNAGFFCVPMYYRGAGEAHFTALCPVVIKPQNWIVEDVVYALEDSHRQRAAARRLLGTASHRFDEGTRSSLSGAVLSALLGPLATAPLLGRILFPRVMARMHRTARRFVAPPAITRMRLEREEGTPASPTDEGIGFTLSEMVSIAERSLRDIGLTSGFARMVIFLGHGSSCLNNPHESAYHCGACSGSPGGPNARALAAMLNDVRVRRQLKSRGLEIPEETYFVGGLHNTATEEITFYDLELLPTSHVRSLRLARDIFSRVAERNALERCRRFESADLDLSGPEALLHVQERSEDLAQTRPEYGNCTNAICFVGRRSRVRGLYLDRRAFLMSYDKAQDTAENMVLARILGAVIPVCEGINLLYTLSAMDNGGWGAGTKLPHNVTSLLGVMDGTASDLRPGLPWQGVDIHEPVRLLFVVETSPEAMLQIMEDNPAVARICRNGWAQLAVLDPETSRIQRFLNGRFADYQPTMKELTTAESSFDWYRDDRGHRPFALIRATDETGVR